MLVMVPGTRKSLQHVLEHQASGENLIRTLKSSPEGTHLRRIRIAITAKGQRSHTGIDEQAHRW